MSYETTNYLPKGVSKAQAVEFARLLGYQRAGSNAHLGAPDEIFMTFFDEKDYKSWEVVELTIGTSESAQATYAHTRTTIGRSHFDFEMQNRTVREFRRRFGGTATRDGGNGEGYDPGPPVSPAASGCHLALQRFDWNLTRVNHYLYLAQNQPENPLASAEKIWPHMRQINPDVFVANVLVTYLVSAMEDYFKSTYVALLSYSQRKQSVLKGVRLSGEQLADVADGKTTIEQAVAEVLPFQRLSAIGRHFLDIEAKLDVLAPLKRPYRRRKIDLLTRLEALVTSRHALVHKMSMDISLDRKKLDGHVHDLTVDVSRVYETLCKHYGWPFELPITSNFSLQRHRRRKPSNLIETERSSKAGDGDELPVVSK